MIVTESSDLVISDVFSTATDNKMENNTPTLKCRMCEKCWPGTQQRSRDNYHSHLLSSHFKHLWEKELPASREQDGGEYACHVNKCGYQTKLRDGLRSPVYMGIIEILAKSFSNLTIFRNELWASLSTSDPLRITIHKTANNLDL